MSETKISRKNRRNTRWISGRQALLLVILLPILLIALLLILASSSPGWFQLADRDDVAAGDHGQQVEFRLVEEFQLIRPEGEVWRLRIRDSDLNAWLSTRLLPWLSHEQNFRWPEGLSRPQVRFTSTGIEVAARVQDFLGGDRVVTLGFRPEVADGRLTIHPGGVALGRLPVPFARSGIDTLLEGSLAVSEGALAELAAVAMGTATMEALIPLVDSRQVHLSRMEFESGAVVLEAMTIRNQDSPARMSD